MANQQLSQSPSAIRKRRSRQKRRNGLESFRLAIRARDNLHPDAVVSKQHEVKVLQEAIDWWETRWLAALRKPSSFLISIKFKIVPYKLL
jgi:hypothetical protein